MLKTSTNPTFRRPRSPMRAQTGSGREYGISVTATDAERCALLARWYCLSKEHVARAELPAELWHPDLRSSAGHDPGLALDRYRRHAAAVRDRFAKLAAVQVNMGNHTGPLVDSAFVHDGKTAWFSTRFGATAGQVPWSMPTGINSAFAAHAWTAADVGSQLERHGYRVLSERELSTGLDRDGNEVTYPVTSTYVTPGGVVVEKKPDVVVVSPTGPNYIAIEVERLTRRPIRVYAEKLAAYERNTAISAVWYLCGSDTTRKRVIEAADKVFGSRDFPLRVHVLRDLGGFSEIRGLAKDETAGGPPSARLLHDLAQVDPNPGAAA